MTKYFREKGKIFYKNAIKYLIRESRKLVRSATN